MTPLCFVPAHQPELKNISNIPTEVGNDTTSYKQSNLTVRHSLLVHVVQDQLHCGHILVGLHGLVVGVGSRGVLAIGVLSERLMSVTVLLQAAPYHPICSAASHSLSSKWSLARILGECESNICSGRYGHSEQGHKTPDALISQQAETSYGAE